LLETSCTLDGAISRAERQHCRHPIHPVHRCKRQRGHGWGMEQGL